MVRNKNQTPRGSGAVPATPVAPQATDQAAELAAPSAVTAAQTPAPAELTEQPGDAELEKGELELGFVEYVGDFGAAEITREQWMQAGVQNMPTVMWQRAKEFRVPKEAFTREALLVLSQDQTFRIT